MHHIIPAIVDSGNLRISLFHFGFRQTSAGDKWPKQGENEVQESQTEGKDTDIAISLDKHEEKRKKLGCGFHRHWVKEYPRLGYNKVAGKMYCGVCKDFLNIADKNSSFMTVKKSF